MCHSMRSHQQTRIIPQYPWRAAGEVGRWAWWSRELVGRGMEEVRVVATGGGEVIE